MSTHGMESFENQYWRSSKQRAVFRHTQALAWLKTLDGLVLDVGCGDGFFLALLREAGKEAWGVDLSSVAIDRCREKKLQAEVGDFSTGTLPARGAQVATVLDVLEHLYDPKPLLSALHKKVETVIISVPNFVSFPARLQVACGRVPENNTPRKGHMYWYTQSVLQRVLWESGWQIVDQAVNPPYGSCPLVGRLLRFFARARPSFLSLSLVVRAEKIQKPD